MSATGTGGLAGLLSERGDLFGLRAWADTGDGCADVLIKQG